MDCFLKKNFDDGIAKLDKPKMECIIQNYDELRQQCYHLSDEEYADLLYSLLTRLNDCSNDVDSSLLTKLSDKSVYFEESIKNMISTKAIPSYDAEGAVECAKANLRITAPGYYNFHNDGGDFGNSLLRRVRGEKIVQETLTF